MREMIEFAGMVHKCEAFFEIGISERYAIDWCIATSMYL